MASGRVVVMALYLAGLVSAETACQQCCQPGGDCSTAFKGDPGTCCGSVNMQSFCCPHFSTGAKCYRCNMGYRCYHGVAPSRDICVDAGGSVSRSHGGESGGGDLVTLLIVLASTAIIFAAVHSCIRHRHARPLMSQHAAAVELPVAKPVMAGQAMPAGSVQQATPIGYPSAYPTAYPAAYPASYGTSCGGNVAMGAGMGFLGGMVLSDMMSHSHYGGGGDYGGGGGDGGFAADM
mmetsp:Transcript_9872/g.24429  ORF Transcript_9872/g.24429 Transcript_9872/m.24429 type:complete len:235 (+) Transcript_9872:17-721(+)